MSRGLICLCALLLMLGVAGYIAAHPDDELCSAADNTMDPQLCAALFEMNRPGGELVPRDDDLLLSALDGQRGWLDNAVRYVGVGVAHILPDGLDHILFVLAIFLASPGLRPLIWQLTAFTLAHSLTLGLAASGHIQLPSGIVEPLIAFTIAFVAIENLFVDQNARWRPWVIFVFGLIHGLGFAGFFAELGFFGGLFFSSLVGFNLGVELGQLSVLGIAALVAGSISSLLAQGASSVSYQRLIAIPASALIGLIGLYWGISRLFG